MFQNTGHSFDFTPRAKELIRMSFEYGPARVEATLAALYRGDEPGAFCSRCGMAAEEVWQTRAVVSGGNAETYLYSSYCWPRESTVSWMLNDGGVDSVVLYDQLTRAAEPHARLLKNCRDSLVSNLVEQYKRAFIARLP